MFGVMKDSGVDLTPTKSSMNALEIKLYFTKMLDMREAQRIRDMYMMCFEILDDPHVHARYAYQIVLAYSLY